LDHAIVPVYEYGVVQDQPYFVMAFLSHGSLADRLRQGPLAPDQVSWVLARIGGALDYAHREGIVHRDLKASNILFDEDDHAFLTDFGIAVPTASAWERHLASGTPATMSPEQALREGTIEARSDIYSLGIITFEMLTGRLPYEGDTPNAILLKQVYEPPPALEAVNPDLPETFNLPLQRALAKDPNDRYPSAGSSRRPSTQL
jgi:serine/threonine-protein kinase